MKWLEFYLDNFFWSNLGICLLAILVDVLVKLI